MDHPVFRSVILRQCLAEAGAISGKFAFPTASTLIETISFDCINTLNSFFNLLKVRANRQI